MGKAKATLKMKTKKGSVDLLELKRRSDSLKVKIGILRGTGTHPESEGITFAQILYWLEKGTKRFKGWHPLKLTFYQNRLKYNHAIKNLMRNILLGRIDRNTAEFVLGSMVSEDVKARMERTKTPPNSEGTQLRKGDKKSKGKGIMINDPMNWTGQTINAVTWGRVKAKRQK